MLDPQAITEKIEQTFNKIHVENMQGIPVLNPAIKVQALGFQEYQGRMLGVVITPWLMNVVLLPAEGEDWSHMKLGDNRPHEFSSRVYKFMLNDIDGIVLCQTHSIYSPMHNFACHDQAVTAAQEFLEDLMVDRELTEEERVDEELLGKVMRGEETPEINLDDFDTIESVQTGTPPVTGHSELKPNVAKKISRRNLLRAKFG